MDARASVSVVPPAGAPPTSRVKSLRQQRASNGATIIKAYVQQSEQRREQSKFHATGRTRPEESIGLASPRGWTDERWEETSPRTSMVELRHQPPHVTRDNQQTDNAHALDALFSERRIRRSRRQSVVTHTRQPPSLLHGAIGLTDPPGGNNNAAIKPILRRRLQMETVSMNMSSANAVATPLGAKLDALAKNSMLNRRKVVLAGDDKAVKNLARNVSPRHANSGATSGQSSEAHHGVAGGRDGPELEAESRVMAAFRQIVRLWRERKRRAEAAALSRMNGGNATGVATGTGRNGSKLRKDLTAQQSNVVGIISKRLIREIPALKFFDEETEPPLTGATVTGSVVSKPTVTVAPERAKPRGVCYTLDSFGCRKIKMQSSTTIAEPSRQHASNGAPHKQQKHGSDELTLEKAMHRSLHRKMARRIKSRRQSILRLGDEFSKARNDLAMKLRSQLALQHAQIEKMFSKRLALLMTDDTTLPPYMAQKELHLARVRCRKANLLEKCETLRVLGMVLQHVEAAGNGSGMEVSTGELHFLDLFRCVVEENHVLTPIISNAIRQHMRRQDLTQPLIMELFQILERQMTRQEHTE